MGKSNKANRTKGNTRPSSSEHSAHLLSLSGRSISGFIGFNSSEKDIPTYIPVTGQHSSDAADLSVDSDLRMVMRKMLKRDSTTRLKAVQEFGDLCSEKDKDTVKNVLPFWPRLFNKLALDHDRRIREATHQANGKLISKVKREIAPYLKNIMGCWLLGQNDLHAPAASVAQATFTDTFPKTKQSEALMYCKNEIFSLFKDNLFEQTAKSLSDPSSTSVEDMEQKYTLVISATLQAMKLFFVTVTSNEYSNLQTDYVSVISDNKFWKYSKNKESQIRASWYALISYLCHVKPDLFAEMEKKLVPVVFGCLSESDPVVAPVVWESALHVVVNFDNCWQEINIQKVILPQLWTLLNEGGRGNAHVVYPCILPFLSKLPKDVITKETFILQLFTCLKHSLLLDSVRLSVMECDAILTTFMESLQYISFCVLSNSKEGSVILERILSDHVLTLVEISFYENKHKYLVTSKFYSLLGELIQKFENKCLNSSSDDKLFSQALTLFWDKIYNIFCKLFEKKEAENAEISMCISYFFHSIFSSAPSVKSGKNKVRFDDEDSDVNLPEVTKCFSSKDLPKKMPLSFMHITKFIKILCMKIDENANLSYLKILDEILAWTLSDEFLKVILKSYQEFCDTSEKVGLTFFNAVIVKWITIGELDSSSTACVRDIVFSLCASVSEDEALEMLNSCCKVKNPVFFESVLTKALSNYIEVPVVQNWLKSPALIENVLYGWKEMMEMLLIDETEKDEFLISTHRNIICISLANKDLQDSLNQKGSIEGILMACREFIEKGFHCKNTECILEVSCSVIEAVLLNFKNCWNYSITDNLLSALFCWKLNFEEYGLSEKACSAISQVWHFAIFSSYKNNVVTRNDGFLMTTANELHSSLCSLQTSKKATSISNEIVSLLQRVEEVQLSLPVSYSSAFVLSNLIETILPSDLEWQKLRKKLILSPIPQILKRKFIHYSTDEAYEVSQEDLCNLFLTTKAVMSVFTAEINKHSSCEDEQYFQQYIVKCLPDLLWCISYYSGNGYLSKDSQTVLKVEELDSQFQTILKFISYEKLKDNLKNIFYRSLSKGLYWALPFQLLVEKMGSLYPEAASLFDNLIFEANLMESEFESLNVQILSHHVSKEKKRYYLKKVLSDLTSKHSNYYREINYEYLGKLAEICCFVQDSEVIDEEVKILLSIFFTMFPSFNGCPKSSACYMKYISLMSSVVEYVPSVVSRNAWEFLQNFLSSSLKAGKSKTFNKPDDLFFLYQVSLAYSTSFKFIYANEDMELSWTPSVAHEINEQILSLFIHVCGVAKEFYPLSQAFQLSLLSLLKSVKYIPENVIFNYVMQSPAAGNGINSKDEKVSPLLDNLSSILLSDIPFLQLAAHILLIKIMPLLSESLSNEALCECYETEDEEEKVPSKLLPLVDTLNVLNDLMDSILWDIKIGECCLVVPNTEPFAFVSAYLFAWLEMLEFISTSPSQLRSGYVAHLEETKLLSSLFSNVFCLMPENPLSCFKKGLSSDSPKKENLVSLFLHAPQIYEGDPSSKEIQIIACHTFCTAIRKVPASVRTWWSNLDKNSADIVNKFTSKYVSGILCTEEIQAVYNNENLFKNMVVKARPGTREVIATYTIDDSAIELCVQLPVNYPLGPITAEKRGKIVIANQEWRQWLIQLTTVLNFQNGSILDGLNIWKKNLDKKFEGVEECMICYYILHSSSMKLPKLSCHTCRKKFHSACLYKWFQSINNTKCPLCRNEFTI